MNELFRLRGSERYGGCEDVFVNWKRLLLAVYRLEEGQQEILAQLQKLRKQAVQPIEEGASHNSEPDEWIQDGIDNILSYSVEKKKEVDE